MLFFEILSILSFIMSFWLVLMLVIAYLKSKKIKKIKEKGELINVKRSL